MALEVRFLMPFRVFFAAVVVLALISIAIAQQSGGTPGSQGAKTAPGNGQPQAGSTQGKSQSTTAAFSEAVVNSLLDRLNRGFAAHSAPVALSVFDRNRMRDYPRFAASLHSIFAQYESFRLHFHVLQLGGGGDVGSAVVEVEYEATPLNEVAPPVRKADQLRFQFMRTPQGWKITLMQRWNFFSSMASA